MKLRVKLLALVYVSALGLLLYLEASHFREMDSMRAQISDSYDLISGRDEGLRLELEYRRFHAQLSSYVREVPFKRPDGRADYVSHDDVLTWFDIFWSRVHAIARSNLVSPEINRDEINTLFDRIKVVLDDIDPHVQAIQPADYATYKLIRQKLEVIDKPISRMATSIAQSRVEQAAQLHDQLNWALGSIDTLLITSSAGGALILSLFGIEAYRARKAERKIKVREAHVRYLAEHDSLTGLGNRAFLNAKMAEFIRQADISQQTFHLILLDLDKFKDVNDTHGHPTGDLLLKKAATRLASIFSTDDIVVRLGGDEFAVLVRRDFGEVETAVQRIVKALSSTFVLNGNEVRVSTSAGISSYPALSSSADNLMRDADLALYEAKNKGRDTYAVYEPAMSIAILHRIGLEIDLRQAIATGTGGLEVYYQPQVDMKGKNGVHHITGVEALVRWFHPQHGAIPAIELINIAEGIGLIDSLSNWITKEACRDAAVWHQAGFKIDLSVNLSPFQLNNPDMSREILELIEESGFDPNHLTLEITESSDMRDTAMAARMLSELTDRGISLAIDDFGTGYSNLGYLKSLPLHCLKIDRSFVTHIEDKEEDRKLVRGIINLAQGMGLKVVAEGVETEQQVAFLQGENCEIGQGYLFGRPMSKLKIMTMLSEERDAIRGIDDNPYKVVDVA